MGPRLRPQSCHTSPNFLFKSSNPSSPLTSFRRYSFHFPALISHRFIPQTSLRSSGATLPMKIDATKDETRDILAVAWYTSGYFTRMRAIGGGSAVIVRGRPSDAYSSCWRVFRSHLRVCRSLTLTVWSVSYSIILMILLSFQNQSQKHLSSYMNLWRRWVKDCILNPIWPLWVFCSVFQSDRRTCHISSLYQSSLTKPSWWLLCGLFWWYSHAQNECIVRGPI